MYTLVWTAHFTRAAKKFTRNHPELKKKLAGILRDLEKDPFQPNLDYHHLGGKLSGIQAISITDSYRLTMTVMITKKEITLLDIGSHDEVYR
jgi:addiction module RelE/StbE family toxin